MEKEICNCNHDCSEVELCECGCGMPKDKCTCGHDCNALEPAR